MLPEFATPSKAEWDLFLRHVACDQPFRWSFLEGARNVLLAEKAAESSNKRAWIPVPPLTG